MTSLDVVCMLWRRPNRDPTTLKKRYDGAPVRALRRMLDHRTDGTARLICVTNLPTEAGAAHEVIELPTDVARLPSQYPKLWLFSSDFAETFGVGRRMLFTDLDVVLVGDPRNLVAGEGSVRFRANYPDVSIAPRARWKLLPSRSDVEGRRTPPFSTSLFMVSAGAHPEVWERFRLRKAKRIVGWTGTDQKWVNWVLGARASTWPSDDRFITIGRAIEDPSPPGPGAVIVTCTHRLTPWDPEVRDRLPWLAEAYPLD